MENVSTYFIIHSSNWLWWITWHLIVELLAMARTTRTWHIWAMALIFWYLVIWSPVSSLLTDTLLCNLVILSLLLSHLHQTLFTHGTHMIMEYSWSCRSERNLKRHGNTNTCSYIRFIITSKWREKALPVVHRLIDTVLCYLSSSQILSCHLLPLYLSTWPSWTRLHHLLHL